MVLVDICLKQALFYNSQTQFMPRPAVVDKLVKLGTVTLGSSYHYPLKSGFRNSKSDLDTRVSFKYSVSRGVSSTPTFYVNGFELLDAGSPIDFEGWKNTIDPFVNPRELNEKILKEVYAQQKEVRDEENAENIPDLAYSEKEEKLLLDAFFHSDGVAKSLSDVITSSINKLEDKHIADTESEFLLQKMNLQEKSGEVEERAATAVASTLESWKAHNGGGGYSAHYLIKSASGSKCIPVQSKTGI
ncbi:hypothetical protein F2Q69_00049122 [Brassica cretica]|uniref:Thioredoxin-like fold domain-containing protein n=1 Tax=Brassica cretica TaxID=69181 RepID=A0A8S9PH74_BRACR|nr:hypothetical protein F2Q69_00049122 [Brassica cretica]